MRKTLFLLAISFVFTSCGPSVTYKGQPIHFQNVGYFKSEQVRCYTYNIVTNSAYDIKNPDSELIKILETDGAKQMHTSGKMTYTFYFATETGAPDITLSNNIDAALSRCYSSGPVYLVNIDYEGKVICLNPSQMKSM